MSPSELSRSGVRCWSRWRSSCCSFRQLPLEGQQPSPAVQMIGDTGEGAKYWARWRGPSGQGVVTGTGYPDSWSATQNVKWKVPVPGDGNSSPIVWGDRIFLTTAYDGGRRLSVVAFRRTDGTKLWETFAPAGRTDVGSLQERPRVGDAGHRRPAHLRLVRRQRTARRRHRTASSRLAPGSRPMDAYHGTAGSPLLYKDRLILYQDQSRDSFIAAFDTRDRQDALAHTARGATSAGARPSRSASAITTRSSSTARAVHAYNPDTGASCGVAAARRTKSFRRRSSDTAWCSVRRDAPGPTLAIRPGGKGDVTRSHSCGRARAGRRSCRRRSCTASISTWSTTWRASSPASRR